jgi:hypothetical protein
MVHFEKVNVVGGEREGREEGEEEGEDEKR